MQAAATTATATATQRHFVHLRAKVRGDSFVIPTVMQFHHEDAEELNAARADVLKDVLWVLQLHASSILPHPRHFGAALPASASMDELPIYHGELVSCVFQVRQPEGHYEVLTWSSTASAYRGMPVTQYRLSVYITHKARDCARRAKLVTSAAAASLTAVLHPA
jgi:hypothetical protein